MRSVRPERFEALDRAALSRQARLDLLDVVLGTRPAARILVRAENEIQEAAGLVSRLGLDACVARGFARVPGGRAFADGFAPSGSAGVERMPILYVARRIADASSARAADESRDDGMLGRALGYPACCVDSVAGRARVPTIAESIGLYSFGDRYDPLLWPAAALADGSLLPHFPCQIGCEPSRHLSSSRWSAVRDHLPRLSTHVQRAAQADYWIDDSGQARTGAFGERDRVPACAVRPGCGLPERKH